MKITRAADYAIRCCLYMSLYDVGTLVRRQEISESMEIPSPFLGKIAQQLARGGIIEIVQGAKGGYRLLVCPEELSLLAIIEAIMGPLSVNECAVDARSCTRSSRCSVHGVWKEVQEDLRRILSDRKLADLV